MNFAKNLMRADKTEELDKKSALDTINSEIETLCKLRDNIGSSLTRALDAIANITGKVVITGIGKSGHIAKKIAASLASTGTPAFFIHPSEASHGDLGNICKNDIVIAISNSGEAIELQNILNYSKQYKIPVIGMTKNPFSLLGRASDMLLMLPDNGEAGSLGLAPTNSSTATLVWGDILTVALMERKNFSAKDFKVRHPGGKLGASLSMIN